MRRGRRRERCLRVAHDLKDFEDARLVGALEEASADIASSKEGLLVGVRRLPTESLGGSVGKRREEAREIERVGRMEKERRGGEEMGQMEGAPSRRTQARCPLE